MVYLLFLIFRNMAHVFPCVRKDGLRLVLYVAIVGLGDRLLCHLALSEILDVQVEVLTRDGIGILGILELMG